MNDGPLETVTRAQRTRAYSVHVYTASGVILAFLAVREICKAIPDPKWVFAWLALAVFIDATDGPLARRWQVKRAAPKIEGRTIDDIVDYLTFTFVPLVLVWRMGWLPPGMAALLVSLAMVASLFGFANVAAKDDTGFFLGFPSYWNIYAFYAGLMHERFEDRAAAVLLVILVVLTILPVRFLYPNRIRAPWRWIVLGGALVWVGMLVVMFPSYPAPAPAWFWTSLVYPAFYILLSIFLDQQARRARRNRSQPRSAL